MNKSRILGTVLGVMVSMAVLVVPGLVDAQAIGGGTGLEVNVDGAGSSNLQEFVQSVLNLAIGLTAVVAVAFLVYNGFRYITANGDESKIDEATQGITYAIIGLIIAFISGIVVQFVLSQVLGQ